MGIVWRAVDERLERSVAVKKIVGQHGLSPADRAELHARAMREAKNAARLQHPNAIMVFDITEHEGDPCLVMEFLKGHSLSELLTKRGTLPVAEVARIGEQVGSALRAAHQAGIVHRDVKPGNILIDDTGITKLTDFGISRAQGDMTLTATGLVGGTPAYLAPELARGADPAPASDVFALGATLYHSIEGHSPYGTNANQLALLHTAASGKIVPPRHAGTATALLMSMLRPEPAERIGMAQAVERLTKVAAGGGMPEPPEATLPAMPPTSPVAEQQTPPWQRTSPPPRRQSTAMFDAVEPDRPTAARAPASPPPPAQRSKGSGGNGKLIAGGLALIAAVVVAIVLLMNGGGEEPKAGSGQQGDKSSQAPAPSSKPQQENEGGKTIEFGEAGQLVVDFYSFPDGAEASWAMLSTEAQEGYGGKAAFDEYWAKYDAVWSNDAVGSYNDDKSVTITIQVTYQESGGEPSTEQRQVRVVREGGELRIDSGTD